jgi:hypothetical protein
MPTADAARRRRRASVPEGHHARSTSSNSRTTTRMTRADTKPPIARPCAVRFPRALKPNPRLPSPLPTNLNPGASVSFDPRISLQSTISSTRPPARLPHQPREAPRRIARTSRLQDIPRHRVTLYAQRAGGKTSRQDVPCHFASRRSRQTPSQAPPTHPGTGTTNQWACSSWSEHCLGVPSQQSSTVLPGPRYCTAGRLGTT